MVQKETQRAKGRQSKRSHLRTGSTLKKQASKSPMSAVSVGPYPLNPRIIKRLPLIPIRNQPTTSTQARLPHKKKAQESQPPSQSKPRTPPSSQTKPRTPPRTPLPQSQAQPQTQPPSPSQQQTRDAKDSNKDSSTGIKETMSSSSKGKQLAASTPAIFITAREREIMRALSGQLVLPPNVRPSSPAMNVRKLLRDGRRTPELYRSAVQLVSSPSQLSLRSISEIYNLPNSKFNTIEDVYKYRGYKKLHRIDEGAFGVVFLAMRLADRLSVAVKEVDLSRKRNKRIEEMKRELFVLQKIDDPHVVRLYEHFIVKQTLVIIMEFCAGSNLTTYLKENPIDEEEARPLFAQMATGLKILHRKGIAHRDVKLNNFLLDETRKIVKVADFGLSIVSYRKSRGVLMAKTYCGTEPYMAPEILTRNSLGVRSYNPIYADIWSLGICLFAMLTRTFPFKMNLSQRGLYKAQTARRWRFPRALRETISEELRDLIWHMLDPEPDRRITINGVVGHPWLNRTEMVVLSGGEV